MKYFFINNIKYNIISNNIAIIDFCKNIGINIPYFCYHKNLSLAGNCRMCLIEIKNSIKPVVSCTMTIINKMNIYTNSPLVKKSRENILEFLLLNHPLDCPICDQGGECDLQDQSFVFGNNNKRFYKFKRIVSNKNIGPIVKMVMTRCIHCTRCVRFANEIAGVHDLGIFNRGVNSEIGTYISKTFSSELSGNVIDICPVGALTSKQYPYINRSWEIKKFLSIDYTDGFGLNIIVSCKNNSIIKIQPNLNYLNNNWISDKIRFAFDGMFTIERLTDFRTILNNVKTSNDYLNLIYKNLVNAIYFKDHLTKHFLYNNIFNIIIIINENLNLNLLSKLIFLNKKHSFIKIKTIDDKFVKNDLEESFMLKSTQQKYFNFSQFCLLLNINTRYEGYSLNLKLRQNFFKENFKVFSISSLLNLTFPIFYLGSTTKKFIQINEGRNVICQEIVSSIYPLIISNSQNLIKKNLHGLINFYNNLKKYNKNFYNYKWKGLNLIQSNLSSTGINLLKTIDLFSIYDLNSFNIIYLLNLKMNFLNLKFKKYLELKLITTLSKLKIILIEQNFLLNFDYKTNRLQICTENFFENKYQNFFNTEGIFKSTTKIVNSKVSDIKTEDYILKNLDKFISSNICFIYQKTSNLKTKVCFFFFNLNKILNLVFLPSNYLTTANWNYSKNKLCDFINKKIYSFKQKKLKIINTKLFLWLEDFYLNGPDLYSHLSLIMLQCSTSYRKYYNNFLF